MAHEGAITSTQLLRNHAEVLSVYCTYSTVVADAAVRAVGSLLNQLGFKQSLFRSSFWEMRVQFGPKWVGLLVVCLMVAALSGRPLYMDGVHHVIHSMFYWNWFPQPTPRRFFAVVWDTGLIRLFVNPKAIDTAALLYALTSFIELALPAAAIAWSKIDQPLKSFLTAVYFSTILILGNFAVAESLFAIALTTIFVVYTLDPKSDPQGALRLAAAILLIASYESVALSNIFLAVSCWNGSREGDVPVYRRWLLIACLSIAPVFQVTWYLINPTPKAGIDLFVVILALLQLILLLLIAVYFKFLGQKPSLRYVAFAFAFAGPIALFFLPQFLHVRSDLFRFAYPSRFYGMAAMGFIALLPLLTNNRSWRLPSKVLAWYGERAANDLSVAMCLLFCGVTLLTALDTYSFRAEMQKQFTKLSGEVPISRCRFCAHPEEFRVADLGYTWTWQEYSMAYSMHMRDGKPVVIMPDATSLIDGGSETNLTFSKQEIDVFLTSLKSAH